MPFFSLELEAAGLEFSDLTIIGQNTYIFLCSRPEQGQRKREKHE
jgi:hypothetical protein